ncbi:MAG: MMPL family transporter [Treponema sp.]|nr:MMPL family transporter [Treponema sp.]
MKKLFSRNSIFLSTWILFHVGIVVVFLATLKSYGRLKVDADFSTMIPASTESEAAKIADEAMSANSGSSVFILSGDEDFQKAKAAAVEVYEKLKSDDEAPSRAKRKFKNISLYTDSSSFSDVEEFIKKNRFNILGEETQKKIDSDAEGFAKNALEKFFGFSIAANDPENDPFALDDEAATSILQKLSASTVALRPKDGVLARSFEGKWYVMVRAELTKEGAKMADKSNAVQDIYDACLPLEKDGTKFAFFGTPFHSYKSSMSASKEITLISIASMIAVVAILLAVFKSVVPLLSSVAAIALSVASAFLATHAFFGGVHAIALVFGTTLIGSCIDYSLHFFINWKASKELKTGGEIRRHLMKGLLLSLVSTEVCYLILMFAPFNLLKQISVFSFFGILSSFLTTIGIFPLYRIPKDEDRRIFMPNFSLEKIPGGKKTRKAVISLIFACSIFAILLGGGKLRVKNDVTNLYKMEGRLKEDTETAFKVLSYNPTSYLVISGDSAEEVLRLEEETAKKIPDPFISTSLFLPSLSMQKNSIEAVKKLLPFAKRQLGILMFGKEDGFSEEEEAEIQAAVSRFEENLLLSEKNPLTVESPEIPQSLKSILKMTWLGEADKKFYSLMIPSTISGEENYRSLENENIHYMNKAKDVSRGLDDLTRMIFVMFAIAFVIISATMKLFHSWKDTLKIISVPVVSIVAILATFTIAGLHIEFFCMTGIVLVFGLGLDYVIYSRQNKGNALETFAITLSFITTAISFGAIALSSFVPVHVLGLSIFSGLAAAFVCTML